MDVKSDVTRVAFRLVKLSKFFNFPAKKMTAQDKLIIATRESPLALWQAKYVQATLKEKFPNLQVPLLGMTTRGDKILDVTLSKVGGKGLFVKELESAMLEGSAQIAVHSLKDVPMELMEPFVLGAVMVREDPRDAFVSHKHASLEEMPAGSKVGTASLRRELMIRSRFPHLKVEMIRGNVGTRLSKLDAGQYDALVMAAAGLKRLGLEERIRSIISTDISLPAPGQGAIGIEAVKGDEKTLQYVCALNDRDTLLCTQAERAVSRALGGSCQVPLAAYATIDGGKMFLRALVGNHLTGEVVTAETLGPDSAPEENARKVIDQLTAKGAQRILSEVLGK